MCTGCGSPDWSVVSGGLQYHPGYRAHWALEPTWLAWAGAALSKEWSCATVPGKCAGQTAEGDALAAVQSVVWPGCCVGPDAHAQKTWGFHTVFGTVQWSGDRQLQSTDGPPVPADRAVCICSARSGLAQVCWAAGADDGSSHSPWHRLLDTTQIERWHPRGPCSLGAAVGSGSAWRRRCVQRVDQPVILTGYAALNKLLGREVYTSHMQLGGPKVLHCGPRMTRP